jgi:hypothetical protein
MFAATAYDAAMVLCAALTKAEATGAAPASDEYKKADHRRHQERGRGRRWYYERKRLYLRPVQQPHQERGHHDRHRRCGNIKETY